MSARTVLVCNDCGLEEAASPLRDTAAGTRQALKEKGWVYWRRGVDYCATCWPKRFPLLQPPTT